MGKTGFTRAELVGDEEVERLTPDIGPMAYLLNEMARIGEAPVMPTMSGARHSALPWSEIMAWPGVTRLLLCEVETIKRLSQAIATMRNTAGDAPQPWIPDEDQ